MTDQNRKALDIAKLQGTFSALVVDGSRDEPLRIYPYDDCDSVGLYRAVKEAMFHGEITAAQDEEVAEIVGGLLYDGEVALEDATLRLRGVFIPPAASRKGD